MSHVEFSTLFTSITTFFLAFFVWSRDKKKKLYVVFAFYSISISLWSLSLFISIFTSDKKISDFFAIALHLPATFIPIFFAHFINEFLDKNKEKHNRWIKFSYILYLVWVPFFFSKKFLVNEPSVGLGVNYYTAPASSLYFFYVCCWITNVIYGIIRLGKHFYLAEKSKKIQLAYLLFGTLIGYAGGANSFLLVYKLKIFPFFPFGNYGVALYVFLMTYAIIAHNLLDVEVIVRRTAVFAGLFAFVYGTFTVITIIGQEFFKSTLGWNQWIATIPTVAIITFSLRPLEVFLTNTTEKFLFQKKYDYKDLLRVFTNEILTVMDLQALAEKTVQGLSGIVKLESAAILFLDKDTKTYKTVASSGVKEKVVTLPENHILINYLKKLNAPIQADKDVQKMETGDLKEAFKMLNAKVCLPIEHHDELIGVLALGMKKSGEDFAPDDLDILMTLARTEAIAIANAQLFDELSKTQAEAAQREKMAVIGTLAAGINHEICNPLGIVRGQCEMFLLNHRDGFYNEKSSEDLLKISSDIMNKVIRETDRATSITKKLSSFARPSKRSDFEEVSVEKEIEEVIGLVGHDLKISNIDIQKDFPLNFPHILADKKQVQEVLFNLIRNAAQAMDKKDGKIVVSGFIENGLEVIRLADNGSGIPPEKLEQIFHPFYTTKAPGKGTGLGLFIVKQVVERNNGTIAVESQLGVGTTFTLRFALATSAVVTS